MGKFNPRFGRKEAQPLDNFRLDLFLQVSRDLGEIPSKVARFSDCKGILRN